MPPQPKSRYVHSFYHDAFSFFFGIYPYPSIFLLGTWPSVPYSTSRKPRKLLGFLVYVHVVPGTAQRATTNRSSIDVVVNLDFDHQIDGRNDSTAPRSFCTMAVNSEQWDEVFKALVTYKERNGHFRIPQSYICHHHHPGGGGNCNGDGGLKLGKWVNQVRYEHSKNILCPLKRRLLDSIGFQWSVRRRWIDFYDELVRYKESNGHCRVPKSYETKDGGFKLGRWVVEQRTEYSRRERSLSHHITPDKISKLNSIGFIWYANERYRPTTQKKKATTTKKKTTTQENNQNNDKKMMMVDVAVPTHSLADRSLMSLHRADSSTETRLQKTTTKIYNGMHGGSKSSKRATLAAEEEKSSLTASTTTTTTTDTVQPKQKRRRTANLVTRNSKTSQRNNKSHYGQTTDFHPPSHSTTWKNNDDVVSDKDLYDVIETHNLYDVIEL